MCQILTFRLKLTIKQDTQPKFLWSDHQASIKFKQISLQITSIYLMEVCLITLWFQVKFTINSIKLVHLISQIVLIISPIKIQLGEFTLTIFKTIVRSNLHRFIRINNIMIRTGHLSLDLMIHLIKMDFSMVDKCNKILPKTKL